MAGAPVIREDPLLPEAVPVCPDCTYPLTGLIDPRCPECGQTFDRRLLTDASLARPRPDWERQPHVSLLAAFAHTAFSATFRPATFFSRIQQPDRLRRSMTWAAASVGLALIWMAACIFGVYLPLAATAPSSYLFYSGSVLPPLWSVAQLVSLPILFFLLCGDAILRRDRVRFRLLFKGAMYGTTVYVWVAFAVISGPFWLWIIPLGMPIYRGDGTWINWLLAAGLTWHFGLIYRCVLGPKFAALLAGRPATDALLALLAASAWLGAMYLCFTDYHLGFRFQTAFWGRELEKVV